MRDAMCRMLTGLSQELKERGNFGAAQECYDTMYEVKSYASEQEFTEKFGEYLLHREYDLNRLKNLYGDRNGMMGFVKILNNKIRVLNTAARAFRQLQQI